MLYPSTEGYNMITYCRVRYDTIVNCSLLSVAEVELRLFIDNWFVRQEDDSDCGGGTCLSPCLWPMLGLQLLLLWLITSSQHSWPLHRDTHTHTPIIISLRERPEDTPAMPSRMYAEHLRWDILSAFPFSNAKGCSFISSSPLSKMETHLLCSAALIPMMYSLIMVQE